MNVAILIFNNVELLDFAGPQEIFHSANRVSGNELFQVYTVCENKEMVIARQGLKVIPDYSIKDCLEPDILIIPGGEGRKLQMKNPVILDWIKTIFDDLQYLFSICTGAFILGNTGLLKGLKATTHHASFDEFEKAFPGTELIRNVKYVDNGKIITSAGIASGMKASLYLLDKISGSSLGQLTAGYTEYDN